MSVETQVISASIALPSDLEVFGWACVRGKPELVKSFLRKRTVDPRTKNYYLIIATHLPNSIMTKNHLEIIRLLLEDGRADPSVDDCVALHYAIAHRHIEMIKLLSTDKRIDPSLGNNELILYAARGEGTPGTLSQFHLDLARLLHKDGRVDPTVENCKCVKLAMAAGNLEMVKILVSGTRIDLKEMIKFECNNDIRHFLCSEIRRKEPGYEMVPK